MGRRAERRRVMALDQDLEKNKIQIGDDCLLAMDINSDWYICGLGYTGNEIEITLRRKAFISHVIVDDSCLGSEEKWWQHFRNGTK